MAFCLDRPTAANILPSGIRKEKAPINPIRKILNNEDEPAYCFPNSNVSISLEKNVKKRNKIDDVKNIRQDIF